MDSIGADTDPTKLVHAFSFNRPYDKRPSKISANQFVRESHLLKGTYPVTKEDAHWTVSAFIITSAPSTHIAVSSKGIVKHKIIISNHSGKLKQSKSVYRSKLASAITWLSAAWAVITKFMVISLPLAEL